MPLALGTISHACTPIIATATTTSIDSLEVIHDECRPHKFQYLHTKVLSEQFCNDNGNRERRVSAALPACACQDFNPFRTTVGAQYDGIVKRVPIV
ncbi:uncharacterized protein K489DRAFT_267876 [Dissoconium aciculare CBS 342.82]|uniref:Uncharacterized protein n=1 Tax=Dissoconium aciculare CBS 342.82 TaxID=1314786 RepID=A0A6J3M2M4_9PEZI|nr:uncharacterized protein K489DRAFT_267876 [Dissoconium aciculare CBS 342.82]KAF1821167.1 hypothetical protein K489DRAFT_267876 [Dissoconium aciculare CBS 342.82]